VVLNGGALGFGSQTAATLGGLSSVAPSTLALNNGSAGVALTVGGNNASTTFTGTLDDGGLGGSLTKNGTGTLTLTAANAYTGGPPLNAGTLAGTAQAPGSPFGSGNVLINRGTLLLSPNAGSPSTILIGALTTAGGAFITIAGSTGTPNAVLAAASLNRS